MFVFQEFVSNPRFLSCHAPTADDSGTRMADAQTRPGALTPVGIPQSSCALTPAGKKLLSNLDRYYALFAPELKAAMFSQSLDSMRAQVNAAWSQLENPLPPLSGPVQDFPFDSPELHRQLSALSTPWQTEEYLRLQARRVEALEPALRVQRAEAYLAGRSDARADPATEAARNLGLWAASTAASADFMLSHTTEDASKGHLVQIRDWAREMEAEISRIPSNAVVSPELLASARNLNDNFKETAAKVSEEEMRRNAILSFAGLEIPDNAAGDVLRSIYFNRQTGMTALALAANLFGPLGKMASKAMFALMGARSVASGIYHGNTEEILIGSALIISQSGPALRTLAAGVRIGEAVATGAELGASGYLLYGLGKSTCQTIARARRTYLSAADELEIATNVALAIGVPLTTKGGRESILRGAKKAWKISKTVIDGARPEPGALNMSLIPLMPRGRKGGKSGAKKTVPAGEAESESRPSEKAPIGVPAAERAGLAEHTDPTARIGPDTPTLIRYLSAKAGGSKDFGPSSIPGYKPGYQTVQEHALFGSSYAGEAYHGNNNEHLPTGVVEGHLTIEEANRVRRVLVVQPVYSYSFDGLSGSPHAEPGGGMGFAWATLEPLDAQGRTVRDPRPVNATYDPVKKTWDFSVLEKAHENYMAGEITYAQMLDQISLPDCKLKDTRYPHSAPIVPVERTGRPAGRAGEAEADPVGVQAGKDAPSSVREAPYLQKPASKRPRKQTPETVDILFSESERLTDKKMAGQPNATAIKAENLTLHETRRFVQRAKRAGLQLILTGGHAIRAYSKPPRHSHDIDFIVRDEAAFNQAKALLAELGYSRREFQVASGERVLEGQLKKETLRALSQVLFGHIAPNDFGFHVHIIYGRFMDAQTGTVFTPEASFQNPVQTKISGYQGPNTSIQVDVMALEPNDLAVTKLIAGRDKDIWDVAGMARQGSISADEVAKRVLAQNIASRVRSVLERVRDQDPAVQEFVSELRKWF